MESQSSSNDPRDVGGELAEAEAMRSLLAGSLRLPSWFHELIGAAIAVQIGTTTYTLARPGASVLVLIAGLLVFAAVAGVQLARFRTLNGVWVGGLASRAVLGTSTFSAVVYAGALAAAVWAGLVGRGWLAALAAAAGGIGYAICERRWWNEYLRDPEEHARAEPPRYLAGLAIVAVLGMAALLLGRG